MSISQTFRYPDGVVPNTTALAFTLLGWPLGVALLVAAPWWLNALGFVLVVLTLVWSAYFIHEFAHMAIFRDGNINARWGAAMTWINGSCYAPFTDLRRKHMRHHVERADVLTFDARGFLLRSPAWFRRRRYLRQRGEHRCPWSPRSPRRQARHDPSPQDVAAAHGHAPL